ncbi:MAG: hypothetical protein ACI94Y_000684 [Maribacter sp.]|jgi:hypothetical protein
MLVLFFSKKLLPISAQFIKYVSLRQLINYNLTCYLHQCKKYFHSHTYNEDRRNKNPSNAYVIVFLFPNPLIYLYSTPQITFFYELHIRTAKMWFLIVEIKKPFTFAAWQEIPLDRYSE